MAEPKIIEGKKPDREIHAHEIGELEMANAEASGRTSPFWVKCWSCHKDLARRPRPAAPPPPPAPKETLPLPKWRRGNNVGESRGRRWPRQVLGAAPALDPKRTG